MVVMNTISILTTTNEHIVKVKRQIIKKGHLSNKYPTYIFLQFYFDYPTLLDKLQQVDRLKTLFKLLK